jgi:hypothetical protein
MDNQSGGNASVMCQLVSPEGDHLDAPLYLPQNVGTLLHIELIVFLVHFRRTSCHMCFTSEMKSSLFILSTILFFLAHMLWKKVL